MTQIRISKESRSRILAEVNSGTAINNIYIPFIGADPQFVSELIEAARKSKNNAFASQLHTYIQTIEIAARRAAAEVESRRRHPRSTRQPNHKRVKGKKEQKRIQHFELLREISIVLQRIGLGPRPKNYSPTGQSFRSFMREKGTPIDVHPFSSGRAVKFLQGGSPGQGKRA